MRRTIGVELEPTQSLPVIGDDDTAQLKTNLKVLLSNIIMVRNNYMVKLGKSFGGKRDIYTECGYPRAMTYDHYWARYERQDIATRIVDAYPDATWRSQPAVFETDNKDETAFENEWTALTRKIDVMGYLCRLDKLCGIGQYAVLLLGLDGAEPMDKPVGSGAHDLIYLMPFAQREASILSYVTDTTDENYGKPEFYSLTISRPDGKTDTVRTHYSRVMHIADGLLASDTYGTPRLQSVYNRLQDLETVLGGGTEMFWKGGFPGISFEADPLADLRGQKMKDLEKEVQEYYNGLRRYMRLTGVKANTLAPNISDPTAIADLIVKVIAGSKGMPVRILMGSERGELASSTDQENWDSRVVERRVNHANFNILRKFVKLMIKYGVVSTPTEGIDEDDFKTEWPKEQTSSPKDKSIVAQGRIVMLKNYCSTPGAEQLYTPKNFLVDYMEVDEEKADAMLAEGEKAAMEEQQQAEQDAAAAAAANLELAKAAGTAPMPALTGKPAIGKGTIPVRRATPTAPSKAPKQVAVPQSLPVPKRPAGRKPQPKK